jgi:hypothetical protein
MSAIHVQNGFLSVVDVQIRSATLQGAFVPDEFTALHLGVAPRWTSIAEGLDTTPQLPFTMMTSAS